MTFFQKVFRSRLHRRERIFSFIVLPILLIGVAVMFAIMFRPVRADRSKPAQPAATPEKTATLAIGRDVPATSPTPVMAVTGTAEMPAAAAGAKGPMTLESLNAVEQAAAMNKEGQRALNAKDFNKAFKCFQKATQLDPRSAAAWNNLGAVLLVGRQDEPAVQALSRALELNRNSASIYMNRAQVLRRLGKLDDAIADQEKLVKLMPAEIKASNTLLIMKLQAGRRDEVVAAVKSSQELGLVELERGTIMAAMALNVTDGDLIRARATLLQAMKILSPDDVKKLLDDPIFAEFRGEKPAIPTKLSDE